MPTIPYEQATSGTRAREEIIRILRQFGCSSVGFRDEFDEQVLYLGFTYRGRDIQLKASAAGWAALYLRERPWSSRRRSSKADYERGALEKGLLAVNSILRDWIKGQITAVESGIVPFGHVFLPYMLTNTGESIAEIADRAPNSFLLPPMSEDNCDRDAQ